VAFDPERGSAILIVEDVEETRYGMERLLVASGHQVSTARDEEEPIVKASLNRPDLILISLGLNRTHVVAIARRIRERSALGEELPVVIFCAANLDEGAEVRVGYNVFMTRPDNFDQLRAFLSRLLRKPSRAR
jgi:DNA-binding response OmpR family regulator